MNEKEFKQMLKKGESQNTEFKKSTAQMERALKAMCGFLNHKGGCVYFGISDNNGLIGQDVTDSTLKSLSQKIRQKIKPEVSPEIKVLEIDGRKVIEVKIKEGSNKPYYLDGIAYKRVGTESPPIPPEELERIILRKNKTHWDEQVCVGSKLEDIDESKVRWFLRESRHKRGLDIPEDASLKEVLMQLNFLEDDKLVNASVLLFGKRPERFFIQSEVKCIALPTSEFVKPYNIYQAYEGNLFEQVDKTIAFVLENIRRPLWVDPRETAARNPYELPREAVREAIVNAIMHRDYSSPSKVQVRVFPDRLEIWNPGQLPAQLSVDDLKKPHPSVPYNPLLFRQFYRTAYVEDVGGGTVDIIGKCREFGLPEPEFNQKMGSFVVTIWRSILTEEYLGTLGLNERERNAIEYVKENRRITNKEYQEINNVSKPTATRELNELAGKRVFAKHGKTGKGTYYALFERAHKGLIKGSR